MSYLGHVFLAGSLLIGQEALAQTTPNSPPTDKVTTQAFTATMSSKVQDIVASTKNSTPPAFSDSTAIMKTLVTPPDDERRYNIAVENAREQIGGVLSFEVGQSGARMGLGNNLNGGGALVIKGNLNMNDTNGKSKGAGTIEGGMSSNGIFVTMKMRF